MLHVGDELAFDCYEKCIDDPHGDNKNDLSVETLVNALRCASKSGSYTTMINDSFHLISFFFEIIQMISFH